MAVRLSALRPLCVAVVMLLLTALGTESALRIIEPPQPLIADGIIDGSGLCEPSRVIHHRLCPLRTVQLPSNDGGGPVEITVNPFGIRGPDLAVPKPPGVYRVILLGDETVLGSHIPESQTVAARLQQLLQAKTRLRVEVLNGGVPGDCPLLAALRLQYSHLALQPDLVILHFDMSDVADDQRYRRCTRLDDVGNPVACTHPLFDRRTAVKPWWHRLRLLNVAAALLQRPVGGEIGAVSPGEIDDPQASTAWLRDNPPDWSVYIEQALSPLDSMRHMCEGTYSRLMVCTCPQPWQVSADATSDSQMRNAMGVSKGVVYTSLGPFEAIAAYSRKQGIPFCDTSTAFRDFNEPARLYFAESPELSRYGHEVYARVLDNFIAKRIAIFGGSEEQTPEAVQPLTALPEIDVRYPPGPTAERELPYYR